MKMLIIVALFFWFVCGFAGEWRLDGLDDLQWKGVARGPLTLMEALNDNPVHVPGTG